MKKASTGVSPKSILENYRAVGLACLIGILITATVLFLSAWLISSVDFPQSGITPLAIGASVVGCFSAGFLCCKMTKGGGLIYGLLCGTVIFFLCLFCEVVVIGGELGLLAVYKLVVCVTSAMIGGVLGVNQRRKAH